MSGKNKKTTVERRGFIAIAVGATSAIWALLRRRKTKSNVDESKPPKWIGHY